MQQLLNLFSTNFMMYFLLRSQLRLLLQSLVKRSIYKVTLWNWGRRLQKTMALKCLPTAPLVFH